MTPARLVDAHLEGQRRLRHLTINGVGRTWLALPSYRDDAIPGWLSTVVPLVDGAQRQSILLTDAYIAMALDRPVVGLDAAEILERVRPGVTPQQEWRRPFETTWTSLSRDATLQDAIVAGLRRAESLAGTDVQLASWAAMQSIQEVDPRIRGWRRVTNPGACTYCQMIDGAVVKRADAAPLHASCGCALAPLEEDVDPTPLPDDVAVREHGELGPVVGDPAHSFDDLGASRRSPRTR